MRYNLIMRTTLELDDELVRAARELAKESGTTIGKVISGLALRALESKAPARVRNGVPLFAPKPGAKKPNRDLVNQLRDES